MNLVRDLNHKSYEERLRESGEEAQETLLLSYS